MSKKKNKNHVKPQPQVEGAQENLETEDATEEKAKMPLWKKIGLGAVAAAALAAGTIVTKKFFGNKKQDAESEAATITDDYGEPISEVGEIQNDMTE